ncbi:MAG: TolC family protein [Niabella sp.]
MKKISLPVFVLLITLSMGADAQQKWSLQQCVEYALANNISVKQADVQARFDKLTLHQSQMAVYPSVNSQHSGGWQFGRSIDPTSNQFTTNQILYTNHGLNVDVDIFNWFRKKNTIAADKFTAQASDAKLEKARNDIALNVANAYLVALLNKEQINVGKVQIAQSTEQLQNIKKQVDAGELPELNLAEMETQLATDSSSFISAKANYDLAVLQLKALLNIDAAEPFDIATPPVEAIPIEPLAELDPAVVFASAQENLPQQKINDLNLKAAAKNVLVARSALYPSISLFGGLSSRYSDAQKLLGKNYQPADVPIGSVNINGINYVVNRQTDMPTGYDKNTYFRQMNNNFSQNIGMGLSIPIFNGETARTNWRKAKLNVESQQLLKDQDVLTLKQDIYQAHVNAVAALEKYNASLVAQASAQKAYDFAVKRFEVGLLKPIDLITNQNNLFNAKINTLSAHYDYVFKMKLLEFYKGKGLRL